MATDVISSDPIQAIPLEHRPNVDQLVTEDDTPVDNFFSEKQQRLLTEPLYSSWTGSEEQRSFVAAANVGLFFAIRQPALVPDVLLSLDVKLPADLQPKSHRSYFVWEYGKPPDVVIEVVSNREGREDSEKMAIYARIRVPYYVIFDPGQLLSSEILRAYSLDAAGGRKIDGPISFPEFGLGLRIWEGSYEEHESVWLRWVDAEGELIPTGREGAEVQRQLAESERQQAESERQRADRLAEKLRQLGVDPSSL